MVNSNTLEKIHHSALKFLSPITLKKTYAIIVKEAAKIVGADFGTIYTYNNDHFETAFSTVPLKYRTTPRSRGFTYQAYSSGKPTILSKKQILEAHPDHSNQEIQSLVIIPLRYRKFSAGILVLQTKKRRYFTGDRLKILKLFGSIASLGIHKTTLYKEVRQAVQSRDFFLAMASHELKTPLTVINNYCNLLYREKDNHPHSEWIENMEKEVKRLSRLVAELLEADRIKTGQLNYSWQKVSMLKIITTVKQEFIMSHPDRQFIFQNHCQPQKDYVYGDEDKLQQVLINLLNNAVKYSDSEITVELNPAKHFLDMSVTNFGPGIDDKDLPHIFEKYYRSPNQKQHGIGLGLFVVKTIIDEHGGRVSVSTDNKQTTFRLELPLYKKTGARKSFLLSNSK